MFWFSTIKDVKNRIAVLEAELKSRQRKESCARGEHEWGISMFDHKNPFTRCNYCWVEPEKKP